MAGIGYFHWIFRDHGIQMTKDTSELVYLFACLVRQDLHM